MNENEWEKMEVEVVLAIVKILSNKLYTMLSPVFLRLPGYTR